MENCRRYRVVLAMYLPLIVICAVGRSEGRELRPSEHGLAYQNNATSRGKKSPEMLSFFGGRGTLSAAASVPFPEAKNMSDASWWKDVSGAGAGAGAGGRRRDHTRKVLVVATVACGATGVAFLVVAALLFLFQYQKQRSNGRAK